MEDPLAERKIVLEERKLALDESFPKKWGGVLFSAAATVMVAVVTVGANYATFIVQKSSEQKAADAESERTQREASRLAEETKRIHERDKHNLSVETARSALEIYFKSYDPSGDEKVNLYNLKFFAIVSDNEEIRRTFEEMRDDLVEKKRDQNPENIEEINASIPSLGFSSTSLSPELSDFTIYIQYPRIEGRDDLLQKAKDVRELLQSMGANVPGLQGISEIKSPNASDVRFYKTEQEQIFKFAHKGILEKVGINLKVIFLRDTKLPDNRFEIWIGKLS